MKHIVVGVSGGIAAFKTCQLVSNLVKKYEVQVIMTKNATEFINPLTFETLTKKKCLIDTFDRNFSYDVEHISIAKWADVFVIAPCSANVLAKIAHGICDDMLTTTFLASKAKKLIVPAMNTNMYENPITQANIQTLSDYGMMVLDSAEGYLACGDVGKGKMVDIDVIEEAIEYQLVANKPLLNKTVLISAGPTIEAIDPVRFISNHSSGKMGYELAKAAYQLGANVTLVSGRVNLKKPLGINTIDVLSANDMYEAIMQHSKNADYIIMASAIADYTPTTYAKDKLKKSDNDLSLDLKRTKDILKELGQNKQPQQVICGFAMETQNLIENAKAKLINKQVDMMVANNIKVEGAGFMVDTNVATLILANEMVEKPLQSKKALALDILNKLIEIKQGREIC